MDNNRLKKERLINVLITVMEIMSLISVGWVLALRDSFNYVLVGIMFFIVVTAILAVGYSKYLYDKREGKEIERDK